MAFLSLSLFTTSLPGVNRFLFQPLAIGSIRNYAQRRGTRERKRKKLKGKVEVEKIDFVTRMKRSKEKNQETGRPKRVDESTLPLAIDNVYVNKFFKVKVYPFIEAINCHKETHHPEMYNRPTAPLIVNVELNMIGEKKTRFLDNFTRIAPMVHLFNHGEQRTVLAFSKDEEDHVKAKEAGAQLAGGVELIKELQLGSIAVRDFQFIIAHPNIMPELIPLRGIMKRKFPNPHSGTLVVDLALAVRNIIGGVTYTAKRDETEKDYGLIETTVGTVDMEAEQLHENFISLVQNVNKQRPKREGEFITACYLLSPPSREKLKVEYAQYIAKEEDDEVEEAVAEIL